MTNPYRLPNRPRVTIRDIVVWFQGREATMPVVRKAFGLKANDAGQRLMKLHRWGYLQRWKPHDPPRIYHYALSRFGRRQARAWS